MPRALRKRSYQPSQSAVACGASNEEAAKQLKERDVESETDMLFSDHGTASEVEVSQDDGPRSTTKKSVVRRKISSPVKKAKKEAPVKTPVQHKSRNSDLKSVTGHKVNSMIQMKAAREPIHHDSRKAPQHKDGMLTALLGSHVPLHIAAARSKVWSKQVTGPQSDFIAEHGIALDPSDLPHIFSRDNFELDYVTDKERYPSYLSDTRSTDVCFIEAGGSEERHETVAQGTACTTPSNNGHREAFTLNTGLSNQSADWVLTTQKTQFLVIGGKQREAGSSPLFEFASGSGTIQIWELNTTIGKRACTLSIIFLHDFGTTWQVKWCPAVSQTQGVIGWLAAVFGDGIVRIWPVDERSSGSAGPELRKLHSPAYKMQVPETKCTKLDWLSEVSIAVACANGMYVVWDLSKPTDLPYTVAHPHSSFINNISACSPSVHDIILTSSWDCDITFTHIRQAETDYLSAARERMPVYALAWSDFLNSAITNEDLSGVRNVAMRTGNSSSIATMAGTVTALATHAKHPFVAIGDASGAVMVVNLCRKVLWKKHDQFQRKIFQVDWTKETNAYHFIESFPVEELLSKSEAATVGVTNIYPREICVTDLVWNGNVGYEALLASCTTNFVRIDDLTTDG